MTVRSRRGFMKATGGALAYATTASARAQGRTLDQAKADLPLKGFPAVAGLPNEELRGTEWENLDIHGHNIERLWTTLDRSPR